MTGVKMEIATYEFTEEKKKVHDADYLTDSNEVRKKKKKKRENTAHVYDS